MARGEAGEVDTVEKEVDEDIVEGIVVAVALIVVREMVNSEGAERVTVPGEMVSGEAEAKASEGEEMDMRVTAGADEDEVKRVASVAGLLPSHNKHKLTYGRSYGTPNADNVTVHVPARRDMWVLKVEGSCWSFRHSLCPSFFLPSFPPFLCCCCRRLVEMHPSTFVLVFLTLFAVLSAAHPIAHFRHGKRTPKIKARADEGACKPPATNNAALAVAKPTPSPSDVPDDIPESDSEPSSTSIAKPSRSIKPSSSPIPTSTSDGGDSEPTQTPSTGGGSSSNKKLFPSGFGKSFWTTADGVDGALPLSDATLKPTKVLTALSRDVVKAPDGKLGMKAHYPQGSYTFTHDPMGGFSFYAKGPSDVDLSTALEATFGYSVFFEDGFDYQLGGKLLGFYGGDSDEVAVSCSGGRRDTRCWSTRLMWRTEGQGELYTYLPSAENPGFEANNKLCSVAPKSECNPTYGASVGRGAFNFKSGQWNTVSQRVRLNDVGQSNGELQLFFNGQSVINVSGLKFRSSAEGRFRGIQAQTFFGGSKPEYASPKAQDTWFSDFSVAITKTL